MQIHKKMGMIFTISLIFSTCVIYLSNTAAIQAESCAGQEWIKEWQYLNDNTSISRIDYLGTDIYGAGFFGDDSILWQTLVVKWNSSGDVQWAVSPITTMGSQFRDICAYGGNIYACGGNETPGGDVALIVKMDLDGNLLWNRTLSSSKQSFFWSVWADSDGIFAAGEIEIVYPDYQFILVKYDAAGTYVWNRTFNPTAFEDNGYSITADSQSIYFSAYYGTTIVKYTKDGTFLWNRTAPSSIPDGLLLDGSDLFVLSGTLAKRNSDGDVIWEATCSQCNCEGQDLVKVGDNVVIAGYSYPDYKICVIMAIDNGGTGSFSNYYCTLYNDGFALGIEYVGDFYYIQGRNSDSNNMKVILIKTKLLFDNAAPIDYVLIISIVLAVIGGIIGLVVIHRLYTKRRGKAANVKQEK